MTDPTERAALRGVVPAPPLDAERFADDDRARFWSKVDKRDDGECWLWKCGTNRNGYGRFWKRRESFSAHRVAFVLCVRDLARDELALHRCDNRRCCNPAHVFTGTHTDNMRDMYSKGRGAVGERHGRAKLTGAQRAAIVAAYPRVSQAALAQTYGVSVSAVLRVLKKGGVTLPPHRVRDANNKSWARASDRNREACER